MRTSERLACILGCILLAPCLTAVDAHAAELTISCPTVAEMQGDLDTDENSILIVVELPDKLSGSRIDRAILYLPLADDTTAKEQIIRVTPAGRSWSTSQTRLGHEDLDGVDTLSITRFGTTGADDTELDITMIMSEWIAGTIENHGLIISGLQGTGSKVRLAGSVEEFRSTPIQIKVWFTRR